MYGYVTIIVILNQQKNKLCMYYKLYNLYKNELFSI